MIIAVTAPRVPLISGYAIGPLGGAGLGCRRSGPEGSRRAGSRARLGPVLSGDEWSAGKTERALTSGVYPMSMQISAMRMRGRCAALVTGLSRGDGGATMAGVGGSVSQYKNTV
eukprot:scaffold16863_cov33-Tisochrysis_lutea.AAC.1